METREENLRLVSDSEQTRLRVATVMIQTQQYMFDLFLEIFWGKLSFLCVLLKKSTPVRRLWHWGQHKRSNWDTEQRTISGMRSPEVVLELVKTLSSQSARPDWVQRNDGGKYQWEDAEVASGRQEVWRERGDRRTWRRRKRVGVGRGEPQRTARYGGRWLAAGVPRWEQQKQIISIIR